MFPTFVIFCWPVVVIVLFAKLERPAAVILSILAGYLLLPVQGGIDLPLLPALEKHSVPALSALLLALLMPARAADPAALPGWLPGGFLPRFLLFALTFGAFMTVLTNGDPLFYNSTALPALRLYDAFSDVLSTIIFVLPLLLARKYLGHPDQQRLLLTVLCWSGLAYSLLALYEVRMSPQLSSMIYGFFPHSWIQHVRGGGYRPIVFLAHGLSVSIFFAGTVIATVGLLRLRAAGRRTFHFWAALWLFMTLVLSKSIGALAITLALVPVVLFMRTNLQLVAAAALTVLVISYPLSRGAGWVPVEEISRIATEFDAQRGASLGVRLINEKRTLDKASERPLFGWGRWGRSRVYDSTGRDISIADGYWAISIGVGGWVKFLAEFLILGAPVVLLAMRRRLYEVGMETSILALIVAGWMVDLLPNSALTPLLWMISGALWGRLELGKVTARDAAPGDVPAGRALSYTRMPRKDRTAGRQAPQGRAASYARPAETHTP